MHTKVTTRKRRLLTNGLPGISTLLALPVGHEGERYVRPGPDPGLRAGVGPKRGEVGGAVGLLQRRVDATEHDATTHPAVVTNIRSRNHYLFALRVKDGPSDQSAGYNMHSSASEDAVHGAAAAPGLLDSLQRRASASGGASPPSGPHWFWSSRGILVGATPGDGSDHPGSVASEEAVAVKGLSSSDQDYCRRR